MSSYETLSNFIHHKQKFYLITLQQFTYLTSLILHNPSPLYRCSFLLLTRMTNANINISEELTIKLIKGTEWKPVDQDVNHLEVLLSNDKWIRLLLS